MTEPAATYVHRVTVRGQFQGLTDRARSWLRASLDEHDLMRSSFTEEGVLTYDAHLRFFNLRYEVRVRDAADPCEVALSEAERFLRVLGLGHGPLRAASMDMSAMTARSADRRP